MPAAIAEQRYYACTDAVNRASGFPSLQHKYFPQGTVAFPIRTFSRLSHALLILEVS
jgi:hypothetical protein